MLILHFCENHIYWLNLTSNLTAPCGCLVDISNILSSALSSCSFPLSQLLPSWVPIVGNDNYIFLVFSVQKSCHHHWFFFFSYASPCIYKFYHRSQVWSTISTFTATSLPNDHHFSSGLARWPSEWSLSFSPCSPIAEELSAEWVVSQWSQNISHFCSNFPIGFHCPL